MPGYIGLKVLTDKGFADIDALNNDRKIMICNDKLECKFTDGYSVVSDEYDDDIISVDDYDFPLVTTNDMQLIWESDGLIKSREISKAIKSKKGNIISPFTHECDTPIKDLALVRLDIIYMVSGYRRIVWEGKRAVNDEWRTIIIRKHPVRLQVLKSILKYLNIRYIVDTKRSNKSDVYVLHFHAKYDVKKDLSLLDLSKVDRHTATMLLDELIYWSEVKTNKDKTIYHVDTPHINSIPVIEGLSSLAQFGIDVGLSPANSYPFMKPPIYRVSITQEMKKVRIKDLHLRRKKYTGIVHNLITETGMAVCKVGNTTFIANTYETKDFK